MRAMPLRLLPMPTAGYANTMGLQNRMDFLRTELASVIEGIKGIWVMLQESVGKSETSTRSLLGRGFGLEKDQKLKALINQEPTLILCTTAAPLCDVLHLVTLLILSDLPADARILCVSVGAGLESIYPAQEFPQWQFTAVDFDPPYHTV